MSAQPILEMDVSLRIQESSRCFIQFYQKVHGATKGQEPLCLSFLQFTAHGVVSAITAGSVVREGPLQKMVHVAYRDFVSGVQGIV